MTRLYPAVVLAGVMLSLLVAGRASAQIGQPHPYNQPRYGVGYQPLLSPYLNLLRGGNTAANYFLGTVPEIERRQNGQLFRSALLELDQKVSQETVELGLAAPIGNTGHITAFGNTGSYFGSTTVKPPASRVMPPPKKPKQ
jgi:hypothetical protein